MSVLNGMTSSRQETEIQTASMKKWPFILVLMLQIAATGFVLWGVAHNVWSITGDLSPYCREFIYRMGYHLGTGGPIAVVSGALFVLSLWILKKRPQYVSFYCTVVSTVLLALALYITIELTSQLWLAVSPPVTMGRSHGVCRVCRYRDVGPIIQERPSVTSGSTNAMLDEPSETQKPSSTRYGEPATPK